MKNLFLFKKWPIRAAALALLLGIGLSAVQAQMAYVANRGDNNLSVIDMATGMIGATVPTTNDIVGAMFSPDGQQLYLATYTGNNEVLVFDPNTNTVTDTITMSVNGGIGIAISPDGSTLYVSSENSGVISVINTVTKLEETTIPTANGPTGLAISPDGTEMYVALFNTSQTRVIDLATNTVVDTITVGPSPRWATYSPDGSEVYISNGNGNTVNTINTTTRQITATYPVGTFAGQSVTSLDGSTLYVANQFSNNITVIDLVGGTVTNTITVGEDPAGLDITPDGTQLMVTNRFDDNVMIIDIATEAVINTIAVGDDPTARGSFIRPSQPLMPSPPLENTVYVLYQDTLGTLDPATGALTNIGRIRDVTTDMTVTRMANLAVNQAGEMYVSGHGLGMSPSDLYRIDPATGQVELVGSFSGADLKGMAFDLNDSLLAVEWNSIAEDVYRFNSSDGSASLLFDNVLPASWYGGMEYRFSDGLMYLSDWSDGQVHTVDPVSGTYNLAFSGDAVPGHQSGDLFFDGDDNLYIATGIAASGPSLWQVDLANGTSS
ncbi:MAG: beta-propeller fold lactonase family protein, partial [Bacteroidota bacterium]